MRGLIFSYLPNTPHKKYLNVHGTVIPGMIIWEILFSLTNAESLLNWSESFPESLTEKKIDKGSRRGSDFHGPEGTGKPIVVPCTQGN